MIKVPAKGNIKLSLQEYAEDTYLTLYSLSTHFVTARDKILVLTQYSKVKISVG